MSTIRFETTLLAADVSEHGGSSTLLTLPKNASAQLPSRGMTIVEGTMNGFRFRVVLEPDGQGSHWFSVDEAMRDAAGIKVGDIVALVIEPVKVWPEPKVTTELEHALAADPQVQAQWLDITPMARWDWLNWMDSVKQAETRRERPDKLCSMLKAGKRRPCCFNRTLRTRPKQAEPL